MTAVKLPELPEPALLVLLGAAGAGKSTLAGRWPADAVVSLDRCRAELADGDESDQSVTPDAVRLAHRRISQRCAAGRTTVVDATNATAAARATLVAIAARHRLPAVALVLATPLELCLARNAARPATPQPGRRWARRVPEAVVAAQHGAIHAAVPALAGEGFAAVHVVAEDRAGCPADRHGTDTAYRHHGCRCTDARDAWRRYHKRRAAGLHQPALMLAVGVQRRLRALSAIGWPGAELAARLGVGEPEISRLAGRTRTVTRRTFERVVALYDALSMTAGPSNSARRRARRRGWPPPLAWDEHTIDDPAAEPKVDPTGPAQPGVDVDQAVVQRACQGTAPRPLTPAERAATVARLATAGHTDVEIAHRCGGTPELARLYRAGHRGPTDRPHRKGAGR